MMSHLIQLGYDSDALPSLIIVYTTTENRYAIDHMIDPELPLWSGDRFREYMLTTHKINQEYCIEKSTPITGTKYLFQLGLEPNVTNVANIFL